jgi:glycosyltransferase involved in cell wall biosynthesis
VAFGSLGLSGIQISMKIQFIADGFLYYKGEKTSHAIFGGQEILLLETCRLLLRAGHSVQVVQIGSCEREYDYEGIRVKQIRVPELRWLQRLGFIRRWTWAGLWLWPHVDRTADWVHFHNHHLSFPFGGLLKCRKTGMNHGVEWDVPWVYERVTVKNIRDRFAFLMLKLVTRASVRNLDALITNDHFFVHYTTLRKPHLLDRFVYIPNFPSPIFKPEIPPSADLRARFAGSRLVLLPKMAMRERGTDIMFECMRELGPENVRLVITGTSDAAPQYAELARTLGIADWVHFTGHVDFERDLPAIYAAADVVVIPSPCREATAIAMLEGMAMRKPMVISNIGGLPEAAKDEYNALVRNASPGEFTAAIRLLLADGALAERLAQNAHSFVSDAFSKGNWDRRILAFFSAPGSEPSSA